MRRAEVSSMITGTFQVFLSPGTYDDGSGCRGDTYSFSFSLIAGCFSSGQRRFPESPQQADLAVVIRTSTDERQSG
jgi:hypothetical protein